MTLLINSADNHDLLPPWRLVTCPFIVLNCVCLSAQRSTSINEAERSVQSATRQQQQQKDMGYFPSADQQSKMTIGRSCFDSLDAPVVCLLALWETREQIIAWVTRSSSNIQLPRQQHTLGAAARHFFPPDALFPNWASALHSIASAAISSWPVPVKDRHIIAAYICGSCHYINDISCPATRPTYKYGWHSSLDRQNNEDTVEQQATPLTCLFVYS